MQELPETADGIVQWCKDIHRKDIVGFYINWTQNSRTPLKLFIGYHAAQVSYQGLKDTFSDHNHDPGSSAGLHCMVSTACVGNCQLVPVAVAS
ncbi:hypothetical protein LINPERPRIM_LOCUS44052 [Linum perenne]